MKKLLATFILLIPVIFWVWLCFNSIEAFAATCFAGVFVICAFIFVWAVDTLNE